MILSRKGWLKDHFGVMWNISCFKRMWCEQGQHDLWELKAKTQDNLEVLISTNNHEEDAQIDLENICGFFRGDSVNSVESVCESDPEELAKAVECMIEAYVIEGKKLTDIQYLVDDGVCCAMMIFSWLNDENCIR